MPVGDFFFYFYTGDDIAVVPILANAGAALLPAIVAGIGTFFALLFKPAELMKACKEKPLIPVAIILLGSGIYAAFHFWPAPGESETTDGRRRGGKRIATAGAATTVPVYIDWTEIALARIQAKQRGEIMVVETATVPAATVQTDEPVIFRGGPHRLGAVGPAPDGALTLAWDYYPSWIDDDGTIEIEKNAMILSSPAVHGNRVYAASCVLDPPDSYGILFCVDATTGKTVWSIDQVEEDEVKGFFSSPAVTADGKYLIIGQGLHPDKNCRLICIDTEKGKVHWTVSTELHLESSPAIENGIVYIGAGAIEDPATHKPISHTGYVMAVRIADGKELWRYDVADPESSPIVRDGIIYIGSGFNGNAVVALRAGTDEELKKAGQERLLWKTDAPYPITGAVTLVNGYVIIGGGNGDFVFRDPNPAGTVMAIEAKTGAVKWQTQMPDAVLGAVAAEKYLICPVAAGKVIALDPQTGKQVWATSISGKSPVLAGAAVADGCVYAVSSDGYLAKLSLSDGKVLEKAYINATDRPGEQGLSISSPMIVNGRLFVGSETGGLRCYAGGQDN